MRAFSGRSMQYSSLFFGRRSTSLLEDKGFQCLCEDGDGGTNVRAESGERVRAKPGGVIHDSKANERMLGSNGEEKELSLGEGESARPQGDDSKGGRLWGVSCHCVC